MNIPKDPYILLSYLNTQLRDHYINLDDLCKSMLLEKSTLIVQLSSIGYTYREDLNQFTN